MKPEKQPEKRMEGLEEECIDRREALKRIGKYSAIVVATLTAGLFKTGCGDSPTDSWENGYSDWKNSYSDWNDGYSDWNDGYSDWNDSYSDWNDTYGDWSNYGDWGNWSDSYYDWNNYWANWMQSW